MLSPHYGGWLPSSSDEDSQELDVFLSGFNGAPRGVSSPPCSSPLETREPLDSAPIAFDLPWIVLPVSSPEVSTPIIDFVGAHQVMLRARVVVPDKYTRTASQG